MATPLLEFRAVNRTYSSGGGPLTVLKEVSLTIQSGEFVAIMGASGSGKSTLMNIIGCLDKPSSGTYSINGLDVATLNGDELAALRRDTFGLASLTIRHLLTLFEFSQFFRSSLTHLRQLVKAKWPWCHRERGFGGVF